ncbi:MAG: MATE family efflux transporter, partial [Lachnospiraceae bacterium]|nr:MATE family efflux transporter [Lachnospiraceae bacterium]
MTKNMTEGSPMKLILGFSIPLLVGYLFQQFYSIVDTIIVGKYLGIESLAAVGATGSVCFLTIGFCGGTCSGFAIPLAHKFGAGDYVGLRKFVANTIYLSVFFSVLITTITAVLCRDILVWMRTPDNILDESVDYLFIIFLGIPTVFLYNVAAGIIRSLGDSKTPVYFLLLSSFTNIALDLLFIMKFGMGVKGAAYATVISQGISGIACVWYMIKKFEILRINGDEWKFESHMMGTLCKMGVPMGLQYSITAIGGVVLQSATNTLGSMAVASITAGSRIANILGCPFEALGNTMATYGGQNVGAKRLDRIGIGLKECLKLGIGYSVGIFVITLFTAKYMALMFVDASEIQVIENVKMYLYVNTGTYILLT